MSDITPLTADNWWEMIPGRKEGGAKLLKRCIELLAWRVDFAMNVLLAYKDFLEAKVSINDFDGTMLEPSIPIFQMWSQHILDTASYSMDCQLLFRQVIHYDPNIFKDHQNRTARISRTMQIIYEKTKGAYVDPIVWNYGHPPPYSGMPMAGVTMPPGGHYGAEADVHAHQHNKRPRTEGRTEGFASYEMAPVFNKRNHAAPGRVPTVESKGKPGTVTLCIYKSTDGGAMDNKVTLERDQPLRKVLDYYRYRCIWRQGKRLDLYCTPNEIDMGPAENVILTSIHVDEVVTLRFRDWNGKSVFKEMRMRDTIRDAYADEAKAMGFDISNLIFQFRNNVLSMDATPLLAQLDHGDVVDVTLNGRVKTTKEGETPGKEKKLESKDEGGEAARTTLDSMAAV